ncbi:MAG: beta-glucuronidase [Labilibaculum sp.]|nr:beta-glucuronidase [Labilibaculum sp.]
MKVKFTSIILLILMGMGASAQNLKFANPKDIALTPRQNNFRNKLDLSGIWKFKKDSANVGEKEQWFNGLEEFRSIAVPGSWNEQFTDMRDYLDWVWYETETYIPKSWKGEKIFIRVNDATYAAKIWVNGNPVGQHEGCHVPFAFTLNDFIKWDAPNRISIQVENILSPERVPTGNVPGSSLPNYPAANYDFFPYAGLNRSVLLYSVPDKAYIKDITVRPDFEGTTGKLDVLVEQNGVVRSGKIIVSGFGQEVVEPIIFKNGMANTVVEIPNVHLWSPDTPDLYDVTVVLNDGENTVDEYSLETGVRTVSVTENEILLNGKPIFLKGFGKHQDYPINGRGTALPVMVKDFELMKWTGANSFRTTHYPYDEEFYHMADREGIMIIGETPAVGLFFSGDSVQEDKRQEICMQYMHEMIYRDKNHPSVIMWCVANEPSDKASLGFSSAVRKTKAEKLRAYKKFEEHFKMAKALDPTRLVMYVGVMMGPKDWFALTDVIAINRYYGWYTSPGNIEMGANVIGKELDKLHEKFKKPCMVTEFGADSYPGFHSEQLEMFTEEFQKEFIKAYLDVADSREFVTGMHIWNFADFKTSQAIIRFGGYNYKGVFTRDRKPKMAAHYLRERWNSEAVKE